MLKANPSFMRGTNLALPNLGKVSSVSSKKTRSLSLCAIFLISILAPLAVNPVSADVITSDATWSGNYVLTSDLIIESGSKLTIQSGSVIDAKEYAIIVNGTLEASNVEFLTTTTGTSSSHGAGIWTGIVVNSGGLTDLDTVKITGAETAVVNHGQLIFEYSEIEDVFIGIDNQGNAEVSNSTVFASDVYGIRNQGTMNLYFGNISNSTIGLVNTGQIMVADTQISNAGVGFDLDGGSSELTRISTQGMLVGIASAQSAAVNAYSWTGSDMALALDLADSDDFHLDFASISSSRFVYATALQSSSISDVTHIGNTDETRAVLDVNCVGFCDFIDIEMESVLNAVSINGQGTTNISQSSINSTGRVMDISGAGTTSLSEVEMISSGTGISVSSADLSVTDSALEITSFEQPAVVLLGGNHRLDGLYVNKSYSALDTSSIAMDVDYATISGSMAYSTGFAFGIDSLSSQINVDQLTIFDGEDEGLRLIDSNLHTDVLKTRVQTNGADLENSELTVGLWEANLHSIPLLVDDSSSAIVRDFRPQNRGGIADAMGDGELLWGGNSTPSLLTSSSAELLETPVTFTDLNGNPVRANIEVNRFSMIADENGAATLPLLQSGSVVDASLNGSGVRDTLTGGQLGQQMQLPVIPLGDWVIQSGVNAILTAKHDGTPHYLFGDLDLRTGSSLTLKNTVLNLSSGHEVDIESGANFYGESGVIRADLVAIQGNAGLFGAGEEGLVLDAAVSWSCTSTREISNIRMTSTLSLPPMCNVKLTNGSVEGMITVGTQGSFELLTTFNAKAIDKGEPIVGADIIINGQTSQTNSDGVVSVTQSSLTVTDQGRIETGIVTVQFSYGDITQLYSWNTIFSMNYDFIASTITSGFTNDWVLLEEIWSPYYLANDLTIGEFGVFTVRDGVEVRLSEGVSITAVGRIDIGAAVLQSTGSGARWSGIVVDGILGTTVDINGANILESSPAIHVSGKGDLTIIDSNFARSSGSDPLIQIDANSNSEVHISDSLFSDSGSQCIYAQGESSMLHLRDVTMQRCGGDGAYIRSTSVDIDGLEVTDVGGKGLHFTDVLGKANSLNVQTDSGESAIVLDYISGDFAVSNISVSSSGAAGLSGSFSDDLQVNGVNALSIPGIDFDDSAGMISDIEVHGQGTGTGITIHHSTREQMILSDLNITGVSVGIDLHDDGSWQDNIPTMVQRGTVSAQTAIVSDSYPVEIHASSLSGDVEASNSQVKMFESIVDGNFNAVDSTIMSFSNHFVDATFQGQQVAVEVVVDSPFGQEYDITKSGIGVSIDVLYELTDSSGTQSEINQSISVSSEGLPPETIDFATGLDSERDIVVLFSGNDAPSIEFLRPYSGQRFMETELINATVTVSDDLSDLNELTISWTLTDYLGRIVMDGPYDTNWPITDIPSGEYVIEVTVTDHLGATSTKAMDVVITLLDSDGDWTQSCNDDTGRDALLGVYCGPDVSDEDDDNDGIRDEDDAWPNDPCVSKDTDSDGQPDTIDCPEGFTTYLVEDQDDNGDGIMDGTEGNEDSEMSPFVLVILILIPCILGIFLFKRRGSSPERINLSELDERHL